MVFRCERVVLFGTWFGDARAIAELVRHSSSSVLRAGTEALEKLEPEIFVSTLSLSSAIRTKRCAGLQSKGLETESESLVNIGI